MVSTVKTFAFQGIDVTEIEVQVQISPGLPAFAIVGLPDKAVGESRERVRAAIYSLGLSLPTKRITVNLAPADIVKEGSHFDLPIILALLTGMGVLSPDMTESHYALGELSLDARILPVSGILPAAMGAVAAGSGIICPAANAQEALWSGNNQIVAPESLIALLNHFKGTQVLSVPVFEPQEISPPVADLRQVKGQHVARRALEIAAAGGHNLLMSGPPGTGKSLLASCMQGILPPLTPKEILEVSTIYSVAGKLVECSLQQQRPYRAPHHSASMAAMVGGGQKAKPGEVTLAHNGVLFLDELPEFNRTVLESLRQPIETGNVTVARANAHITYPARFQLIAAMNPCKCGYLGDASRACNKAPRCGEDYQGRLSGPLLDRIDLHVDMPMVETLDMLSLEGGEDSATVRARVIRARDIQRERFALLDKTYSTNAEISGEELEALIRPDAAGQKLLEDATRTFRLSMRGYTRVLRLALTIADLAGEGRVKSHHFAEALNFRANVYKLQVNAA